MCGIGFPFVPSSHTLSAANESTLDCSEMCRDLYNDDLKSKSGSAGPSLLDGCMFSGSAMLNNQCKGRSRSRSGKGMYSAVSKVVSSDDGE